MAMSRGEYEATIDVSEESSHDWKALLKDIEEFESFEKKKQKKKSKGKKEINRYVF
jgi:hypothetical protein